MPSPHSSPSLAVPAASPARVLAALRVALGTIWAAAACLLGLWLVSLAWAESSTSAAGITPGSPLTFALVGGIALFAMGQFVFVTVVADRLCPGARRLITYPVHLVLAAMYLLGLLYLVLAALGLLKG
jgi:hypothetical protein